MAPKMLTWSRLIPVTNIHPDAFSPFGTVVQNPDSHAGQPELSKVEANQGSATKWIDVSHMSAFYDMSSSGKPAKVSMNMFVCRPRVLRPSRVAGGRKVFDVRVLERHPFTPQTFIPMGSAADDKEACYLVVVAPTLPTKSREGAHSSQPPYPTRGRRERRSLRERLLGARPNPFTNDHVSSTTLDVKPSSKSLKPKGPGEPDLANMQAFIVRCDQAVTYGPGTWHAPMVVIGEKPIEFVVVQYANGVGIEDCQELNLIPKGEEDGIIVDAEGNTNTGVVPKARL